MIEGEEEEPEVKGMEEMKNDQPKWINETFTKVLNDILRLC